MFSSGQDPMIQRLDELLEQHQNTSSCLNYYPPYNEVYDQEWINSPDPSWSNLSVQDQWAYIQQEHNQWVNPAIQTQWEYDQRSYDQWEYDQWCYNQASNQSYASPVQETFQDPSFPIPIQTQQFHTSYLPSSPQIPEPTEPPSININAILQEMNQMMQEMKDDIVQLKISQQASVVLPEAQQDPKKVDEQLPFSIATKEAPEQELNVEHAHIWLPISSSTEVAPIQGEVSLESNNEIIEEELVNDKEHELVKEYIMAEESLETELNKTIELPKVLNKNLDLNVYKHAGVELSDFQGPRLRLPLPSTSIFFDQEEDIILRKQSFQHLNQNQFIWSNNRPLLPIRKDLYPPPFFDDWCKVR